ncbi:glutamyl-tRNA reductase [Pasteurella multocida]|uniref:glutamyl-tRNA reductase n=1 Tax=Pasteurella multocida TaxID=747 RepID=UPI000DFD7ADC|nr:glutamyl-tRNA reductase [Pasteurella multocida]MCL7785924.1 glutamyl-tRNA reductase [Pasteurella multocida]MCL7795393.1 glutamyl-tRNA reductase [Pasteurella multocida]URI03190.1 glutamyl-tRNA reductase [Pasteurella multocida]SUB46862.1 glutamyl-tRNA reductase [Pasteurella multocida subsp. septica]HDR1285100.1 glutamyl-tRNA reductase [Pasteurella multocida]
MTILVIGINHKTASVAIREKVAFSAEKRVEALAQIQQQALAESAVILSTCNRTEVYFHHKAIPPQEAESWTARCMQWFAEIHQLSLDALAGCLYSQQNQQAVLHLMRVACGLDSLVLGEPQILGQVKDAYQLSKMYYQGQNQALSSEFSRLFQKTFSVAKRVRTETNIGGNAVSVAYGACSLARQIFDSLKTLNVLLVGAGETIELTCRHLLRHGVQRIMIANRTFERAQHLVTKLEGAENVQVLALTQLQEGLNQADIVISSTGSPTILITQDMVKIAQKARCDLPMLLVDIAVPRDIEESVGELDSIYHYTVDDLQTIIQRNLVEREKASAQAWVIIQQECADFFEWLKVHQFSNLIRSYRENAEDIRQILLEKALLALRQGEDSEAVLQALSYKLTNKLLHSPTQVMNAMVKTGNSTGLALFSSTLKSDVE